MAVPLLDSIVARDRDDLRSIFIVANVLGANNRVVRTRHRERDSCWRHCSRFTVL